MSNEELVKLYQSGDNKALDKLIEQNKGIVYKIANKYKYVNRRYDKDSKEVPEDLVQAGYLGLIEAAQRYKFDCENRAQFITYAVYWISREIHTCVNGRGDKETLNNKFYSECGSLNVLVGEENDMELGEFIEDIDYGFENVEEIEFIRELRIQLEEAMKQANTLKEREILKFRYGWDTSILNLREIGDIFNITTERARQTEVMALRKLRNSRWARANAKELHRLGYIDDFYVDILRMNGIDI